MKQIYITFLLLSALSLPELSMAQQWSENFEGCKYEDYYGELPVGFEELSDGWSSWSLSDYPSQAGIKGNKLCAYAYGENLKLSTPKLSVRDGEKLSFDVARYVDWNQTPSVLKVYYSSDKKDWKLVRTVSSDATEASDKITDEVIGKTAWGDKNYAFSKFEVDGVPAGEWYIAFEAGNVYLDNIEGYQLVVKDHDVALNALKIPSKASAGKECNVSVEVVNNNLKAETAEAYTLTLTGNGKNIAIATPKDIAAGKTQKFTFTFVPESAGEIELKAIFTSGDYTVESATAILTVGEADNTLEAVAGKADAFQMTGPLNLYYNYSVSECVYNKNMLTLAAGDKISSIEYYGYNELNAIRPHVRVYIENLDEDVASVLTLTDTGSMTPVFDGEVSIATDGTKDDPVALLEIELSAPFEYTGGGLRVIMSHDIEPSETSYTQARFETASSVSKMCVGSYWDAPATSGNVSTMSLPVAHFHYLSAESSLVNVNVDESRWEDVTVYDLTGRFVARGGRDIVDSLPAGVYIMVDMESGQTRKIGKR